ncbi:hypothetical protein DFH08DRAFT_1081301 [Mycena albidolilacea]|uniref:Uncharacterized protein n=1 Tax=Mycena albidolilacea TaxID=1033008 RepID=A0AAD7ERA3_9AGAR|nr:hypothetical protein DFH08DRAFT_1081301 [Mycena albidolilacea]
MYGMQSKDIPCIFLFRKKITFQSLDSLGAVEAATRIAIKFWSASSSAWACTYSSLLGPVPWLLSLEAYPVPDAKAVPDAGGETDAEADKPSSSSDGALSEEAIKALGPQATHLILSSSSPPRPSPRSPPRSPASRKTSPNPKYMRALALRLKAQAGSVLAQRRDAPREGSHGAVRMERALMGALAGLGLERGEVLVVLSALGTAGVGR